MNTAIRPLLLVAGIILCVGGYFFAGRDNSTPANEKLVAQNIARPGASSHHPGATAWAASPFAQGEPVTASAAADLQNKSSPAPIYGRNGRPVDFGGLTATQFISKWSTLARSGNKEAAYKVYQAESVCATNDEALENHASAAEREQSLREREELKKLCEGVSPAQVQERLHFLADAARDGNAKAQIDFYMEGPYGRSTGTEIDRNDPLVRQWKDEALRNLKAAAGQGEAFALGLLAQTYYSGQLGARDLKMALEYNVAEAAVRRTSLSLPQLKRRFGAKMSDAEFQNAIQAGAEIAEACCKGSGNQ